MVEDSFGHGEGIRRVRQETSHGILEGRKFRRKLRGGL